MPIAMEITLHDGNCPAGTVNDAVIKFLETSHRTNAGGWRMNLEADSIGKWAKLTTPVPWITWCGYRVTIKSAPGNWKLKTVTYEFESLEKDKDFDATLRPQIQNMVMEDTAPPPPTDTTTTAEPPPPTGTVQCPTCGQDWTLPATMPTPPPSMPRLIAVYTQNGMPVSGIPWIAGAESGVTDSQGQVFVNTADDVSLTLDGDTISMIGGDEVLKMDVSDTM
jgi:hypothetical protein